MTYPPQPPGAPGQPGFPGPQGHGGQGWHGRPGGGFPPSGPQPQPQYPPPAGPAWQQPQQPSGWGQQGWDQQQDPYAQTGWNAFVPAAEQPPRPSFPDGGGPGGPPKKKRTGLIIGLAAGGAVLVGGVVALVLLLGGGDDPQPPAAQPPAGQSGPPPKPGEDNPGGSVSDNAEIREVAGKAAESINNRDLALAKEVACNPATMTQADLDKMPPGATVAVAGEPAVTGSSAVIAVTLSVNGKTENSEIRLKKSGARWCIGS